MATSSSSRDSEVKVSVEEKLKQYREGSIKDLIIAGVRVSLTDFEKFSAYDFEAPATFYTRSAMGEYYFYHTWTRAKAQTACDEIFGAGRYKVTATKTQKGKGTALTCTGTATRKK